LARLFCCLVGFGLSLGVSTPTGGFVGVAFLLGRWCLVDLFGRLVGGRFVVFLLWWVCAHG